MAQAVGFRRGVVLGEHVRHFPVGHLSVGQETQELLGHLGEVLLVADAVFVRDDDFPGGAGWLHVQAGPGGVEFGDGGAEGLLELRRGCAGLVLDVEGGFVVLLGALLDERGWQRVPRTSA